MKKIIILTTLFSIFLSNAQNFTRRDSLQGGMRFERSCFDVQRYNLDLTVLPRTKKIIGSNEIMFLVAATTSKIQMDLFENMQVDSIVWNQQKLTYKRDNDAVFIEFPLPLEKDSEQSIQFYYQGKPKIAKNAPWDGGFVFKTDSNGKDFIGVAVQGTGASLWYPVKDSQTDEPDKGASIKVAVPNGLMNVSNGRFKGSVALENGFTRWDWEVTNPINTYSITVNIADYVHIHDAIGDLDLDYYVLRENEEKAKIHFEADVKPMMQCFQSKFGKYPFYEDGYKLVETPYLGMEHQSAVAYGNKYKKGYMGGDLSGTGIGLSFDFITIHETGHEWFGNSITSKDIADMWIHEGFTTYSESVFLECTKGYEEAQKYINGQAKNVAYDRPVIGFYGVNKEGSSDMYYKGALLINTLRHITNNDAKWWQMLLKFSETYKKQIIDTETVIAFFNKEIGYDLTAVFKQYLNHKNIPKLIIKKHLNGFKYRWETDEKDFVMPVEITINGKMERLIPTNEFQKSGIRFTSFAEEVQVATDKFFIKVN